MDLVSLVRDLPPAVAVLVLGALPLGELRAALPVALLVYKMPVMWAFVLSVLGNMLPIYFIMLFFDYFSGYLMRRSVTARRFFEWLFSRTRRQLSAQIARYGYWALAIFVAIPLPATGAWSGALAAFVFGLPRTQSWLAILAGVVVAGLIVTAVTLGGSATVRALLAL